MQSKFTHPAIRWTGWIAGGRARVVTRLTEHLAGLPPLDDAFEAARQALRQALPILPAPVAESLMREAVNALRVRQAGEPAAALVPIRRDPPPGWSVIVGDADVAAAFPIGCPVWVTGIGFGRVEQVYALGTAERRVLIAFDDSEGRAFAPDDPRIARPLNETAASAAA